MWLLDKAPEAVERAGFTMVERKESYLTAINLNTLLAFYLEVRGVNILMIEACIFDVISTTFRDIQAPFLECVVRGECYSKREEPVPATKEDKEKLWQKVKSMIESLISLERKELEHELTFYGLEESYVMAVVHIPRLAYRAGFSGILLKGLLERGSL